ncbi:hypothetical protein F2Q69_00025549 [Brassica cretica]|uniref:Uncharacterized protein n=1 Tax=Brassica cretica TaxID=69181 RepID=A0A8S9RRR3_BRACR|nr:hypothetical protein F2Q69_00025549 [Brassica cretica]
MSACEAWKHALPSGSSLGQAVVAIVDGCVRLSSGCGLPSCLGLGVLHWSQLRWLLIFDGQSLFELNLSFEKNGRR